MIRDHPVLSLTLSCGPPPGAAGPGPGTAAQPGAPQHQGRRQQQPYRSV